MKLVSEDLKVTFGYDYYMFFYVLDISDELKNTIESSGLFVEQVEKNN